MRLEGFVEVDEVPLLVTDDGPLEGRPTLLLVHGWGCNATTWAGSTAALAATFRVVSVDLRGHGASGAGARGSATVARLAKDLEVVVDRAGASRTIVVGHSMGGNVATVMAVERPDLVSGLVVLDPAYGADASEMATVPARLATYRSTGGLEPARAIAGGFSPEADSRLLLAARHNVLGTSSDVLAPSFESLYLGPEAFGAADAAARYLPRRTVPTLALYPTETRAATDRWSATPGLTVAIAPVASHFFHEEVPAWFVEQLTAWVERLP